ncbi:MAG: hypothetical protein ACJAWO_000086 [Halieaceae bacterium]|jgi:hypothetical protein
MDSKKDSTLAARAFPKAFEKVRHTYADLSLNSVTVGSNLSPVKNKET